VRFLIYPILRFLETGCACDVAVVSKVTLLARNRVMGGVSPLIIQIILTYYDVSFYNILNTGYIVQRKRGDICHQIFHLMFWHWL
jgi:hypothetical protein